jgi:non-ribosomal peptide synthetase component F
MVEMLRKWWVFCKRGQKKVQARVSGETSYGGCHMSFWMAEYWRRTELAMVG